MKAFMWFLHLTFFFIIRFCQITLTFLAVKFLAYPILNQKHSQAYKKQNYKGGSNANECKRGGIQTLKPPHNPIFLHRQVGIWIRSLL